MGQRANLVVVENGVRTLHYDHWCANLLDVELFWGPRLAVAFARAHDVVDEANGWLDTVWCEGAALIHVDGKRLVWYGGEDIKYDVQLRRAHGALMARTWPDWQLAWAHEGILSIADALDLPRARFRAGEDGEVRPFHKSGDPAFDSLAITVRRPGGTIASARLSGDATSLRTGPALVLAVAPHLAEGPLVWDGEPPTGGVHLDLAARTIDTWWAIETDDLLPHVVPAWPGWKVRWHRDDLDPQCATGALVLAPREDLAAQVLAHVERWMARERRNPAREIAGELGHDVRISPATEATTGSVGDVDEKRRILDSLR